LTKTTIYKSNIEEKTNEQEKKTKQTINNEEMLCQTDTTFETKTKSVSLHYNAHKVDVYNHIRIPK